MTIETSERSYFEPSVDADDAREKLAYFADRCRNCQWESRCPGSKCRVYRAEKEAVAVIAGVPLRQDIT